MERTDARGCWPSLGRLLSVLHWLSLLGFVASSVDAEEKEAVKSEGWKKAVEHELVGVFTSLTRW